MRLPRSLVLLALCLATGPALAHTGAGVPGGLASGFAHPFTGLDHIVAMVAVGVWGAQLGRPGVWALLLCFPAAMIVGAVLGAAGLPFAPVELGIALSSLVLGAAVMMALRPRLWVAAAVTGAFAMVHGYAHGQEMPEGGSLLSYGTGFLAAT